MPVVRSSLAILQILEGDAINIFVTGRFLQPLRNATAFIERPADNLRRCDRLESGQPRHVRAFEFVGKRDKVSIRPPRQLNTLDTGSSFALRVFLPCSFAR